MSTSPVFGTFQAMSAKEVARLEQWQKDAIVKAALVAKAAEHGAKSPQSIVALHKGEVQLDDKGGVANIDEVIDGSLRDRGGLWAPNKQGTGGTGGNPSRR
jgi:hypothetical protein